MSTYILQCPKCKNQMKYATSGLLSDKRKKCVYCGNSFKAKERVLKKL
ncbi:hypothetical protein KY308_02630 [Candidatus Woesearchaeota archaeon]|nr:hypothetical protein [Candidatus Woesearchaeota archaeon]